METEISKLLVSIVILMICISFSAILLRFLTEHYFAFILLFVRTVILVLLFENNIIDIWFGLLLDSVIGLPIIILDQILGKEK